MSLWSKFTGYIAMVCNMWFFAGAFMGFFAKMMWGGEIISMSTGMFVGVLTYMLIQAFVF